MIESAIDGIIATASTKIKAEQGDYIVDGLLYCGKCHTAKQVRIKILGQIREPMCLCKCAEERKKKEEEEQQRIEFEKRVKELRRKCFPEAEMENWTFANDDMANKKVSTVARNYADNFKTMRENGKGLLLFGPTGTGKSYVAGCIANAVLDKGYSVLMTNFAIIRNTVQGLFDGKQEYFNSLNKFDLLILDDLYAEADTTFMHEIIRAVIDARVNAGLPLIITTNLTDVEIKNPADMQRERVLSRLYEMTIPLEIAGKDRRRDKLKADFNEYKDILGI